MLTPQQQAALDVAAPAAVACEGGTRTPASLTLGQWAVESAWGSRCPGNNCFGIKVDQQGSGVQYIMTSEYVNGKWEEMPLAFETYPSIEACFADHARLLTSEPVYSKAWNRYLSDGNVDELIQGIAPYYATAPNYFTVVDQIAHSTAITSAIAKARHAGTEEEITLP